MLSQEQKKRLISQTDLFLKWPSDLIEDILNKAIIKNYGANEYVYQKGELGDGMYGLLKGGVYHQSIGKKGNEIIISVHAENAWFGAVSMVDGKERPTSTMTFCDTTCIFINRSDFLNQLNNNAFLYEALSTFLCSYFRRTFEWSERIAFWSLEKRLANTLLNLCDPEKITADEHITIDHHLTQEVLAKMVASSREAVARRMLEWQKKDFLNVQYGKITLCKPQELSHILNQ